MSGRLAKILSYVNPVIIGYAGYKVIGEVVGLVLYLSDGGPGQSTRFWPGFVFSFGLALFFLYLAWLNWKTVRLRRLEERRPEGKVVTLNVIWLVLYLGIVGILLAMPPGFWGLLYLITDPQGLFLLAYFAVTTCLGVLYPAANAFYAALEHPELGPDLRRRLKISDGPEAAAPPVNQ